MLGINTDPTRSIGFLCNAKIYNEAPEKQIEKIFTDLEKDNYEFFYRQRINFSIEEHNTEKVLTKLALNEIFAAEKDVGKISVYSLKIDG